MPTCLDLTVICDIWPTHPPVLPWQSSMTYYPPIPPTHWTSPSHPLTVTCDGVHTCYSCWSVPVSGIILLVGALLNCSPYSKHWGRVTKICIGKLTIIGSDNGLLPGRRQVIIWNNAGIWILLIGTLETNLMKFYLEFKHFHWMKCIWNCCLQSGGHLVLALVC